MMIGAIGSGGVSFAWRQPQYQYWNAMMRMRGSAALAPASGQRDGASVAASAAVSGQRGGASAAASAAVSGQKGGVSAAAGAAVSGQREGVPAASAAGGAAAGAAGTLFTPPEMPYIPEGYGPEELATRTRIQFPGLGVPPEEWAEAQSRLPWETEDEEDVPGVEAAEDTESAAETAEDAKCETCEKRKYKDGSDDPGVSFKTATRVDPRAAQAAVRGHEMEHVVRERAKAKQEGRKVVSQSVTYHTGICPECGKFYVSGGTTRTVTAPDNTSEFLRKRYGGGTDDTGLDTTA